MKITAIVSIALVLLTGCAKKSDSGEKAHVSYKEALEDSIKNVTTQIDSCNDMADILSDKVSNLLPEFRAVNKAREVEGYMIFQGWENRYPLQSTGLVARLSASRQLELVAVLNGGVFDRIRVNVPSTSVESDIVPYDQAMNYRQGGRNTVLFVGNEADSIASLIADNELNPITVTFLNGGRTTGSWKMSNDYAKMITITWLLYSSNIEQQKLTQKSLLLTEKLKLLRRHQEAEKEKVSASQKDDKK